MRAPISGHGRLPKALCDKARADYEGYWADLAREFVSWKTPFTKVSTRVTRRSSSDSRTAR